MSLDRCAVVIDVREQYEWDAGHVSCATRLQIQKILKMQGETHPGGWDIWDEFHWKFRYSFLAGTEHIMDFQNQRF